MEKEIEQQHNNKNLKNEKKMKIQYIYNKYHILSGISVSGFENISIRSHIRDDENINDKQLIKKVTS